MIDWSRMDHDNHLWLRKNGKRGEEEEWKVPWSPWSEYWKRKREGERERGERENTDAFWIGDGSIVIWVSASKKGILWWRWKTEHWYSTWHDYWGRGGEDFRRSNIRRQLFRRASPINSFGVVSTRGSLVRRASPTSPLNGILALNDSAMITGRTVVSALRVNLLKVGIISMNAVLGWLFESLRYSFFLFFSFLFFFFFLGKHQSIRALLKVTSLSFSSVFRSLSLTLSRFLFLGSVGEWMGKQNVSITPFTKKKRFWPKSVACIGPNVDGGNEWCGKCGSVFCQLSVCVVSHRSRWSICLNVSNDLKKFGCIIPFCWSEEHWKDRCCTGTLWLKIWLFLHWLARTQPNLDVGSHRLVPFRAFVPCLFGARSESLCPDETELSVLSMMCFPLWSSTKENN